MKSETPNTLQLLQSLQRVNRSLASLFSDEKFIESDILSKINELVELRDTLVNELLNKLKEPERTQFVKEEYRVNQELSEVAQSLLASTKDDIVGFIRSQKAVKRYK